MLDSNNYNKIQIRQKKHIGCSYYYCRLTSCCLKTSRACWTLSSSCCLATLRSCSTLPHFHSPSKSSWYEWASSFCLLCTPSCFTSRLLVTHGSWHKLVNCCVILLLTADCHVASVRQCKSCDRLMTNFWTTCRMIHTHTHPFNGPFTCRMIIINLLNISRRMQGFSLARFLCSVVRYS